MAPDDLWRKPVAVRDFLLACVAVELEERDTAYQARQQAIERAQEQAQRAQSVARGRIAARPRR